MNKITNYINGKQVSSDTKDLLPVFDPSTGEELSKVVLSNSNDFEKVINSSKNSLNEWK